MRVQRVFSLYCSEYYLSATQSIVSFKRKLIFCITHKRLLLLLFFLVQQLRSRQLFRASKEIYGSIRTTRSRWVSLSTMESFTWHLQLDMESRQLPAATGGTIALQKIDGKFNNFFFQQTLVNPNNYDMM